MHGFVHGYLDQPNSASLKRFCEKVSFQRLQQNKRNLESAKEILNFGLHLQDYTAALKREWVDLDLPNDGRESLLQTFFSHPPLEEITPMSDTSSVHHQTCHRKYGFCEKTDLAAHVDTLTSWPWS